MQPVNQKIDDQKRLVEALKWPQSLTYKPTFTSYLPYARTLGQNIYSEGNLVKSMKIAKSAAVYALFSTCATAATITLNSEDAAVSITGELVNFAQDEYVVETSYGTFSLPVDGFQCTGNACPVIKPPTAILNVSAQSPIAGLLKSLTRKFAALDDDHNLEELNFNTLRISDADGHSVAEFTFQEKEVGESFAMMMLGDANVIATSRPPNSTELESIRQTHASDLSQDPYYFPLASRAITFHTNLKNPVRKLTAQQIQGILNGSISNWSLVGGEDLEIDVAVQSEIGSDLVLVADSSEPIQPTENAKSLPSALDVVDEIAGNRAAFGFSDLLDSEKVRNISVTDDCDIFSEPTDFNVKAGQYRFVENIDIYSTIKNDTDVLEKWLGFLQSETARSFLEDANFIARSPATQSLSSMPARVANTVIAAGPERGQAVHDMVKALLPLQRLSTTFRFRTGSSQFDARSQRSLNSLATHLMSLEKRTPVVYFVGFTDSVGSARLNEALSLRRAQQVASAFVNAEPNLEDEIEIRTLGFGEISPVGCNTTIEGRNANRRVEVWVGSDGDD